jgi:hypothetical protein
VDINLKLKRVLDGSMPSFSTEYACHGPDKQRWFMMNVGYINHPTMRAVVSHFETTMWHAHD